MIRAIRSQWTTNDIGIIPNNNRYCICGVLLFFSGGYAETSNEHRSTSILICNGFSADA